VSEASQCGGRGQRPRAHLEFAKHVRGGGGRRCSLDYQGPRAGCRRFAAGAPNEPYITSERAPFPLEPLQLPQTSLPNGRRALPKSNTKNAHAGCRAHLKQAPPGAAWQHSSAAKMPPASPPCGEIGKSVLSAARSGGGVELSSFGWSMRTSDGAFETSKVGSVVV
jgi:hypothetical protein